MRGRASGGDPDFGTDSFLDIIANLVGILVILIVLAGLRASQVSLPSVETTADVKEPDLPAPAVEVESADDPQIPEVSDEDFPLPVATVNIDIPDSPMMAELGPSVADAAVEIASLEAHVQGLKRQIGSVDLQSAWEQLRDLEKNLAERSTRIRKLESVFTRNASLTRTVRENTDRQDDEYRKLRARLVRANQRFKQISTLEPEREELELRINPIGRESTGDEVAFLIEYGRVLRIPVRELGELAIARERGNTAVTLRGESQHGRVGPVDGVFFRYQLNVRFIPVSDSRGMVSYVNRQVLQGVMTWSRDAPSEPIDDALSEGGIVSRILLHAKKGTVVRLTISTEDFQHARRISSFCRDLGFRVSAKPHKPGDSFLVTFGPASDAVAQ